MTTRFSVTRNDLRIPIQEFDVGEHVCFLSFSTAEKMAISRELWYNQLTKRKTNVYFHIAAFTRHTRPFQLLYSLDNDIKLTGGWRIDLDAHPIPMSASVSDRYVKKQPRPGKQN